MEIYHHTIKYLSKKDEFKLIPLGDIHLGNACCDIEKVKELVSWIKREKNCFWIGMGDYVDCINYTDKRFDPSTVAHPYIDNLSNCVPLQIEAVIKLLSSIKDKCIGLHRGNHEETIRLRYHYDVMYEMWREFRVPMLLDSAITGLSFQRMNEVRTFDVFSCHGNVGGRKAGYKLNRLEDLIGFVDADVYLMGHSHIKATETKSVLYRNNADELKCKKRVLAVTGCFLKGYEKGVSSYVEKWMYPPTDLGVVKIMINPSKNDIHVSE